MFNFINEYSVSILNVIIWVLLYRQTEEFRSTNHEGIAALLLDYTIPIVTFSPPYLSLDNSYIKKMQQIQRNRPALKI